MMLDRTGCANIACTIGCGSQMEQDAAGRPDQCTDRCRCDKVLVASIDTHTVHALNAESGESLWSYVAAGRVDTPPTLWQGRAIFGCRSGWVYCLRAD